MSNEELYYYSIALTAGFVDMEAYRVRLNQAFLEDETESDILFTLEMCTGNLQKTIDEINNFLYGKIAEINFSAVGLLVGTESQKKLSVDQESIRTLTKQWSHLGDLLPFEIRHEDLFNTMRLLDMYGQFHSTIQMNEEVYKVINKLHNAMG